MQTEVFGKPVVIILVERVVAGQKQVLMQRRFKPREPQALHHCWEFPQGKMREGERLLEAAARELQEETGLILESAMPSLNLQHMEYCGIQVEAFSSPRVVLGVAQGYLGVYLVVQATGDCTASAEAYDQQFVDKAQAQAILASGTIFPLDAPVLMDYFGLEAGVG